MVLHPSAGVLKYTVAIPAGSGIIGNMKNEITYTRADLVLLILEHNFNRGIRDSEAFMDQLYLMIQHDTMASLEATLQELEDTAP
jgi:hypothetical protein